jgi:hypothetical protein
MKQIKVFNGTINGEMFDNVHAYNTRMTELINAGTTNIEANSSTSIKMVDDSLTEFATCLGTDTPVCMEKHDEDLSFLPYFEDDDPHYLDLLVTQDDTVNAEARIEATAIREKCYLHIVNKLYDNDVEDADISAYLEDIRDILTRLRTDSTTNTHTLSKVNEDIMHAEAEFAEAKTKYEATISELNNKRRVLNAARPIIQDFTEFYETVEAEAMAALVERRDLGTRDANANKPVHKCTCDDNCKKCPVCGKCACECECNKNHYIETVFKEVSPQVQEEFKTLFDKIFGPEVSTAIFQSLK